MIKILCLYSHTCSMRGASRGVLEVEQPKRAVLENRHSSFGPRPGNRARMCGARGRGGYTHPHAPGRGRTPPGHTRVPCEELADGVDLRESLPKARTASRQTPPWSAERRPHLRERVRHTEDWCATWRSTPSIFRGARERPPPRRAADWFSMPDIGQARHAVGLPGAPQKIRAHKCALVEYGR